MHDLRPDDNDADWDAVLALRDRPAADPAAWPTRGLGALFGPVLVPPTAADGCVVVGRLAQTLDGRIATASGSSQWIGGRGDILHTHRLRALCHVAVVGAGTVRHDDPRLTTREVRGPNPVRVVLDTERRLHDRYGVFRAGAGGAPTLLACAEDAPGGARHGDAEVLRLPRHQGTGLCLASLLRALSARGLTRIFVEGGGQTVSRFLMEGLLDRLHLTVAPMLLGSGIPAFTLPEAQRIADGLRFAWRAFPLGEDMLFDIALRRARPAVCEAADRAAPPSAPVGHP